MIQKANEGYPIIKPYRL